MAKQTQDIDREAAGPVDVGDEDFQSVVGNSTIPVVLEFWSPECIHCRRMANVVEGLSKELSGRYLVAKVNVLENAVTPPMFGVSGLPSFFLLKGGEIVGRALGAMPKGRLKKELGIEV